MASTEPRIFRWLLAVMAPRDQRRWIVEDLAEAFGQRTRTKGDGAARRWYRRQVVRSIGPLLVSRVEAAAAGVRRVHMRIWSDVSADLTIAARRLRAAPGFAAVCILTLALGIGGNTAVFTLIDQVLLRPLPVPRPAELFRVGSTDACCVTSGLQGEYSLFSYDLYRHLHSALPEVPALAAFQANPESVVVGRPDADRPPETLKGAYVSGNYFATLELQPAAGRLLAPADDQPGAEPVAVISFRAWRDRYGLTPAIAGLPISIDGVAATIVGVAPPDFYGETLRPEPADLWVPLAQEPRLRPQTRLLEGRGTHWLYAIGRLPSSIDPRPLDARLTASLQQWLSADPQLSGQDRERLGEQHTRLVSAATGVRSMRNAVEPSLLLLQAIAAAVLLIACANLANLLLVRALGRRTEMAVRVALGAPRSRLVREYLVESLLLAVLGGAAGLILSVAAARAIVELAFSGVSYVPVEPWPSPTVLGFVTALSLLTGIVFGVGPALAASQSAPVDAMRGVGRATQDRGSRLRRSLVAAQVAMSLVLLTCAGLLATSLARLEAQEFGFEVEQRYVIDVLPKFGTAPASELAGVYDRITSTLRDIPGVAGAAMSLYSPMSGDNWSSAIIVDGQDPGERLTASWNRVTPGYFETIGTPILRGRGIEPRDGPSAPPVAVVSATFARRFFGDEDPLGRRIGFASLRGGGTTDFEIVGVVGDAKYQSARLPAYATFFLPFLQVPTPQGSNASPPRLNRSHYPQAIAVNVDGPVDDLESAARQALGRIDRRLTVMRVRKLEDQVAGNFNSERLMARMATAFGALALLLACLGLFGVTAYAVTQRTREIGIRMAIGAAPVDVLSGVLRRGLTQLAAGISLGIPLALAAGKWLEATLYGVGAWDPLILTSAVLLLGACSVAAVLVPALRAARLDPVRALRVEAT